MSIHDEDPRTAGERGLADGARSIPVPATVLPSGDETEEPRSMPRWLWVVYPLALIGINTVWGAVLQVLLGRQVAGLVEDPRAAAGALGAVLSIASVVALVAQPVMGRLSDLTRTPWLGRRNIWVLGGAVGAVLALLALGSTSNLILVGVLWAVAMVPLSGLQAALTAVLPERVPLARRGTMSGIVAMSQLVGFVLGVTLGGLTSTVFVGYLVAGVVLLATGLVFALTTRDTPAPARNDSLSREQRRLANRIPSLRSHPDFWLTFLGRFLMVFGYFLISGFNLFLLKDYIKVGDGSVDAASQVLVAATGLNALVSLVFAVIGGILSDRFGKVRIFVTLSSLLFLPACIVFVIAPTLTGFFVAQALLGAAFGMFGAVDQVLITRVLPSTRNAARDLGLINVANSGPQVIAPAAAGGLIAATGNYPVLFVITAVVVVLAAITVRFIKTVP